MEEGFPPELRDRDKRGEPGDGFQLPIRVALHKLADVGMESVPGRADGEAQGGRRLALAIAGINLDIALEG